MRLVHGVGLNDLKDSYPIKFSDCQFYKTWKKMLGRCYDPNYLKLRGTYSECSVCYDWLVFSNFKSWMEQQEWEGKALDKDIIGSGKLYSPATCIFVSREVNNFLTDSKKSRGEYPVGVSWSKYHKRFRAYCSNGFGKNIFLGFFDDPDTAHKAYLNKKYELVDELFANESIEIVTALKSKFDKEEK